MVSSSQTKLSVRPGNAATEPGKSQIAIKSPPPGPEIQNTQQSSASPFSQQQSTRIEPVPRPLDEAAIRGLRDAINMSSALYDEDYVNLAVVGLILARVSPDLNARNYGCPRLRDFAEASEIVELKMKSREVGPPIALVRLKS